MVYLIVVSGAVLLFLIAFFFLQSDDSVIEKAEELLAQKRYAEALALLDLEKFKGIEDPVFFYLRARCFEELNDPIKALENFTAIQRIGKYPLDADALEVHKKIAFYTRLTQDDESAFEAYLNVLHINPDDGETLRELGMMAVNASEFFIAAHFLEKAVKQKIEDPELLRAYTVALYQTGRESQAFETASRLVAREPDNHEYNLLFAALCRNSHLSEGKKKIIEILPEANDEIEKTWLARMYINSCIRQQTYKDAIDFLRKLAAEHQLSEDALVELKYYQLVLYLKEQNFQAASKIYDEITAMRTAYARLETLHTYIDYIDLTPPIENAIPFEQIFEETFRDILPEDLVYRLSGLRQNITINFDKFFNRTENGIFLKEEFAPPTTEGMIDKFLKYSRDEFPVFARRAIEYLGYRIINQESTSETEVLDYICSAKEDTKQRFLISFRKYKDNASLSDIFLTNFKNRMNQLKCHSGIVVSNAQLTSGGQEAIRKMRELTVISKEKLADLVLAYEKAKRR